MTLNQLLLLHVVLRLSMLLLVLIRIVRGLTKVVGRSSLVELLLLVMLLGWVSLVLRLSTLTHWSIMLAAVGLLELLLLWSLLLLLVMKLTLMIRMLRMLILL